MRRSRQIFLKNVPVGCGAPVTVQSMTNTDTADAERTLAQIARLADAGCEIIRCAVPDEKAARAMKIICAKSPIPVVADIHFDYRLAVLSAENGAAAVRLNPGNISDDDAVKAVVDAAKQAYIPIRVGANSGSVKEECLHRALERGLPFLDAMAAALCESALTQCRLLEKFGFYDITVSLKSSSIPVTVAAYRRFAETTDYPLHVGVTETGIPARGIVKSSVGIGALLLDGIGDTIRVSLTADPVEEVRCALRILESCGLRDAAPEIVSCPTCGRTRIDLIGLAEKVESLIADIKRSRSIPLKKIAVMGCVVNGPGEARDADLGIAGGNGKVVLFQHGTVIGTFSEEEGLLQLSRLLAASGDGKEK